MATKTNDNPTRWLALLAGIILLSIAIFGFGNGNHEVYNFILGTLGVVLIFIVGSSFTGPRKRSAKRRRRR